MASSEHRTGESASRFPQASLVVLLNNHKEISDWLRRLTLMIREACRNFGCEIVEPPTPHGSLMGLEMKKENGTLEGEWARKYGLELNECLPDFAMFARYWNELAAAGWRCLIRFGGHRSDSICECDTEARKGYFCPVCGFHSNSGRPFDRSLSVQADPKDPTKAYVVLIGWPITDDLHSHPLEEVRRGGERCGFYHKYHSSKTLGAGDNDFFIRVATIWHWERVRAKLESEGRDWVARNPLDFEVTIDDLSAVSYFDTDFKDIAPPTPLRKLIEEPWHFYSLYSTEAFKTAQTAAANDVVSMLVKYPDGRSEEAAILSLKSGEMRCAIKGSKDAAEFMIKDGHGWVSARNEIVEFEFPPKRQAQELIPGEK